MPTHWRGQVEAGLDISQRLNTDLMTSPRRPKAGSAKLKINHIELISSPRWPEAEPRSNHIELVISPPGPRGPKAAKLQVDRIEFVASPQGPKSSSANPRINHFELVSSTRGLQPGSAEPRVNHTEPIKATEPTEPIKGTEPTEPTKPVQPIEAIKPTKLIKLTQSSEPIESIQPNMPLDPAQPGRTSLLGLINQKRARPVPSRLLLTSSHPLDNEYLELGGPSHPCHSSMDKLLAETPLPPESTVSPWRPSSVANMSAPEIAPSPSIVDCPRIFDKSATAPALLLYLWEPEHLTSLPDNLQTQDQQNIIAGKRKEGQNQISGPIVHDRSAIPPGQKVRLATEGRRVAMRSSVFQLTHEELVDLVKELSLRPKKPRKRKDWQAGKFDVGAKEAHQQVDQQADEVHAQAIETPRQPPSVAIELTQHQPAKTAPQQSTPDSLKPHPKERKSPLKSQPASPNTQPPPERMSTLWGSPFGPAMVVPQEKPQDQESPVDPEPVFLECLPRRQQRVIRRQAREPREPQPREAREPGEPQDRQPAPAVTKLPKRASQLRFSWEFFPAESDVMPPQPVSAESVPTLFEERIRLYQKSLFQHPEFASLPLPPKQEAGASIWKKHEPAPLPLPPKPALWRKVDDPDLAHLPWRSQSAAEGQRAEQVQKARRRFQTRERAKKTKDASKVLKKKEEKARTEYRKQEVARTKAFRQRAADKARETKEQERRNDRAAKEQAYQEAREAKEKASRQPLKAVRYESMRPIAELPIEGPGLGRSPYWGQPIWQAPVQQPLSATAEKHRVQQLALRARVGVVKVQRVLKKVRVVKTSD